MKILRASEEDAEQLLELQRVAYQSEAELHDDYEIPPLTQTLVELKADFADKIILKIIDDNKILASGQVRFEDGSSHIGRMAVWPELQGKGIGSQLLSALEKVYSNAFRVELFTGKKSLSNLAMYKHRGYVEFKRTQLGKTEVIFLEREVINS